MTNTLDSLTIVIPCLNERATITEVINGCREEFNNENIPFDEIIVVDNGSTDGSAEIAKRAGARTVREDTRGYGAALNCGIRASNTKWVAFLDADATYRPSDLCRLYRRAVSEDYDLVIGNRLHGDLEDGAMPLLHRYVGTPVLSGLLSAVLRIRIYDCNSGIRCIKRERYLEWQIQSTGMEFASELIVSAVKSGARWYEETAGLKRSTVKRHPKLRPIRDGIRHLIVILRTLYS